VPTDYGRLAFDDNGVRNQADFDVFNLVADKSTGINHWKVGIRALISSSH